LAGQEHLIDPAIRPDPTYLRLVDKSVRRAQALEGGGLEIDFSDGDRLTVPPGQYEAWQLDGDDGSSYVSVAGGGLAVWEADPA
jgi:hypothetical protein